MYDVQVGRMNTTHKKWIPNVSAGYSSSFTNGIQDQKSVGVKTSWNF
jgi:hypothetical protein